MLLITMSFTPVWAQSDGATVELKAVADTTLFQKFPDNNLGRSDSLAVGTTADGNRARGLVRFDLVDALPAGAVLTRASVRVEVTKRPNGPASTFELRRMLKGWAEGEKSGDTGSAAAAGETTWNAQFQGSADWDTAGTVEGTDFSGTVSAQVEMNLLGSYTFTSDSLLSDVQGWLDDPSSNFGWLMRSQSEGLPRTARRIATRERSGQEPLLILEYDVASGDPLVITGIRVNDGQATLDWSGGQPPFQVQSRTGLSGDWSDAGAPVTERTATVPAGGAIGFYRVEGE